MIEQLTLEIQVETRYPLLEELLIMQSQLCDYYPNNPYEKVILARVLNDLKDNILCLQLAEKNKHDPRYQLG